MDLLSFIRTVDPTKVRVTERQRMEDEPRLLETTVGRVVPLLPVARARASTSVDKLFDEGASGDGQGTDIQPVIATADTIVDDILPIISVLILRKLKLTLLSEYMLNLLCLVLVRLQLVGVSGSDFLIGGIRTVVKPDSDLQKVYVSEWSVTNGFGLDDSRIYREMLNEFAPPKFFASVRGMDHDQLFTEFNVGAARQIYLSAEVKDGEIKNIKAQLLLKEAEAAEAIRAAISKAVDKGMQEGLSAGITHGAEGRKLADVAAYNPFVEADYLSALQRLQNVNFSLIAELKSNKDASVDTIMIRLRLDDAFAERLGLIKSQPHANQLMVPIHHSPDQRVVGASALSLSLDVSYSQVRKIRENIASHVSALRGVFVPLSEPVSAAALEGTKARSCVTFLDAVICTCTIWKYLILDYDFAVISTLWSELAFVFRMACFVAPVDKVSWTEAGASNPGVVISFHFGFVPCFLYCGLLSSKRSKLMPKASLFLTMSTSAVLKVGMLISAGITASAP
nr:hypothetical protein [Tanacetum cinerariifolium]